MQDVAKPGAAMDSGEEGSPPLDGVAMRVCLHRAKDRGVEAAVEQVT